MPRRGLHEVAAYLALALVLHALAVLPHLVGFGWAWEWPLTGLDFLLWLGGAFVTLGAVSAAGAWAVFRPKRPRWAVAARVVAVPLLLLGPVALFASFAGVATSRGRGLVARLHRVTPLDSLQAWAVVNFDGALGSPLPPEVADTLPGRFEIRRHVDHVTLWWYDTGIRVGGLGYRPPREQRSFFQEEVRPGIHVLVVEH